MVSVGTATTRPRLRASAAFPSFQRLAGRGMTGRSPGGGHVKDGGSTAVPGRNERSATMDT